MAFSIMKLGVMTFRIMKLSIMTNLKIKLRIKSLGRMALCIMTFLIL